MKDETISDYLRELINDTNSETWLWKVIRARKRPITQILLIRDVNGGWVRSNEETKQIDSLHIWKKNFQVHVDLEEEINYSSPRRSSTRIGGNQKRNSCGSREINKQ